MVLRALGEKSPMIAEAVARATEGQFEMMQSHLEIEQRHMEQEDSWAEKHEEQANCKDE